MPRVAVAQLQSHVKLAKEVLVGILVHALYYQVEQLREKLLLILVVLADNPHILRFPLIEKPLINRVGY